MKLAFHPGIQDTRLTATLLVFILNKLGDAHPHWPYSDLRVSTRVRLSGIYKSFNPSTLSRTLRQQSELPGCPFPSIIITFFLYSFE